MLEYKPVDRLNARSEGTNSGDLMFPIKVFGLIALVIGSIVLLIVGLIKLLP